ncbi:hypothetical protein BSL78_28223 [Apostichopus japonicus]|uniref:Ig-like domain-containing protein n=1 Tax=Stichopus japonicus TaxID=307972 RepID=A0A2G8JGW3_STIJA|nr:hypothetical protein BSL78_28223 [Apostichopus japonicus]
MTDCSIGRLLAAFLLTTIVVICAGQTRTGQIDPEFVHQIPGMTGSRRTIFSCSFPVTGNYVLSWAVNGIAISNSTNVFIAEYENVYTVITSQTFGTILGSNVPWEHHLYNFTCQLYDSDEFVTNSQITPTFESAMATLKVTNRPSESDPICQLELREEENEQPLIEVNCCVELTREALLVSLVQGTVRWYRNKTEYVDDLDKRRHHCFKHTVYGSALSTGAFECILESPTFHSEQRCTFQSFKPQITYSHVEQDRVDLVCSYEAADIVGYTWSVDKDIEYQLSEDRKHFSTLNKDKRSVTVSCTVFTTSGYGVAKLQIIAEKQVGPRLADQRIVIIVGCVLLGIILLLFFIIVAYLIVIRGICFCFRPPDRYSERDLRRMQLERESKAHFRTLHNSTSHEAVQLVIPNGGHRYHAAAAAADEDTPPVPGGNAQYSSHLLDYADLDHGNTPSDDLEDSPAPPQRADNTKVEYADILKPPTTSLRDMS